MMKGKLVAVLFVVVFVLLIAVVFSLLTDDQDVTDINDYRIQAPTTDSPVLETIATPAPTITPAEPSWLPLPTQPPTPVPTMIPTMPPTPMPTPIPTPTAMRMTTVIPMRTTISTITVRNTTTPMTAAATAAAVPAVASILPWRSWWH